MLLALLLLPSAPAAPVHSSPGGLTAVSSTLANSKQPALPSQAEGGNVTLRSIYTDHMVLQHGVAARIVGEASGAAAGVAVSVLLDGKSGSSSGSATTAGGAFQVEIKPQPASTDSHTVTITVAGFAPVTLSDILFGDVYLCSGCVAPPLQACPSIQRLTDCGPCRQSNMGLSVQQSNNATAEIAAANYPRIRITQVAGSWSSTSPQANARFTIPW
jgi:sialate O-acetylesterase